MKVKVTQQDINKAVKIIESKTGVKRRNWGEEDIDADVLCSSCPLSQAVRRQLKKRVWTTNTDITVSIEKGYKRNYHLPEKASKFINLFDEGYKVKPFSFTAEIDY